MVILSVHGPHFNDWDADTLVRWSQCFLLELFFKCLSTYIYIYIYIYIIIIIISLIFHASQWKVISKSFFL